MPFGSLVGKFKTIAVSAASILISCSPVSADSTGSAYSVGGYFGIYSWTNQVSAPDFTDHYIAAATASVTLWAPENLPFNIEADGVLDIRFGQEWNAELGTNPFVFRWTYFPWNDYIVTNVRLAPVGLSYLLNESELEDTGKGASKLNYFSFYELTLSLPSDRSVELFFRQHHRCNFFDMMDDTNSNGSDFYSVGIRKHF